MLVIAIVMNKTVIMEAGLLPNLPGKVDSLDESTKQEYAILLFSLSSISRIKYPLKSSQMITFVLNILDSNAKIETILLCLGTLHNLSLVLENAGDLVCSNVLNILLRFSTSEASEKALATLGNLAVTLMGRKALENQPMVPENFIEILSKEDNPKCQESASYILLILAHQSSVQREKMGKAKIVPVLLEVALFGSPLAQKRALKLLQWFKDERQVKMGIMNSPTNDGQAKEGKKLMTNIVKQSLYKNMERITSRANGSSGSSSFKELVVSSSSKSLPY
ncbi:hypothetical protein LIER_26279 [Lithospermum erythrorhizon]|uniref:Uncharacterized protein n=1 Tax=Lithospermum erythrorhizon TaxID=34254 RepID=A0AAV3R7T1_LITER